ncbi:MAG TPA: endo-1,4-beta-xylanase [Edaphobacter sp.]|nr:endo-1,4-beta-xylanase [Edaphobacter sp.]
MSSGGGAAGGNSMSGGSPAMGGRTATGGGPAGSAGGSPAGGATSGGPVSVKQCNVGATLKASAACNNKLMGTALASGSLNNGSYSKAAQEFNYATPENEMKWEITERSQNNFNFSPGQQIVDFASRNGMKIKGHTLVWHSQLPGWVGSLSTGQQVKEAMLNHINKVMGQWKGKIYAWDVVNEAWETPDKRGNGTATLRNSPFKKIGDDFIDEAFKAAKAADPDALLFYNDYSTEGMNDKSNAVYEMVKSMKARGIPIDGVGIQTHIGKPNDTPSAAEVKENIDRLTALGVQVQISEMDVNGCDGIDADAMVKIYHDIVAACVSNPLCTALSVWGISDSGSWLNTFGEAGCNGRSANALLFDGSYNRKKTYDAVMQALVGK